MFGLIATFTDKLLMINLPHNLFFIFYNLSKMKLFYYKLITVTKLTLLKVFLKFMI